MQTKITTDCLKNNDHSQFNTAQQLSMPIPETVSFRYESNSSHCPVDIQFEANSVGLFAAACFLFLNQQEKRNLKSLNPFKHRMQAYGNENRYNFLQTIGLHIACNHFRGHK